MIFLLLLAYSVEYKLIFFIFSSMLKIKMSVQSSYFLFIEIQKIDQNRSVNPSFTMIKSFISRKLTKIQDFCPQKGCMCSPFRLPLGGASAFLCKHNCFGIQERGKYVTFLQYEYICTNLIVYLRDFRMSNKEHAMTEYLPFASLKLPRRPAKTHPTGENAHYFLYI